MEAGPPLFQLPPELLLRVQTHLTTPELGYLRRTCKHVEAALFDRFAKEFFTKRQFMIEHVSLQALVDIANHPTLSQRLSEIIISVHAFRSRHDDYGSPSTNAGHTPRDVFLETGQARDMLVEAFSKLPNLRTIGLRDYEARGRYRDGENAVWRSYGWSYGAPKAQSASSYDILRLDSPKLAFPLILCALGHARATPEHIEVFLRGRNRLEPDSFKVLNNYMIKYVNPVLTGTKRLMLTVGAMEYTLGFGLDGMPGAFADEDPEDPMLDVPLRRFLRHTPHLEMLRLNFSPNQYFAHRFLKWLGTPVVSSLSPKDLSLAPVALPNLTGLDLGFLNVTVDTLLNVITKFDLVSLNLWKATLLCNSNEIGSIPTAWGEFFGQLATALPLSTRLKNVGIGFPTQDLCSSSLDRMHPATRVYFTPNPVDLDVAAPPSTLLDKTSYRAGYGSSVKHWLKEMSERTYVFEIPGMSSDTDSDEDMNDDDNELDGMDDDDDEEESEDE